MRCPPQFPLATLAEAYAQHLFADDLRERFSHHISHVSSELWLSMELAYVFNRSAGQLGLPGWMAILEAQKVDVTLLPLSEERVAESTAQPVYIECKFIGPDWWSIWHDIAADLDGKQHMRSNTPKPCATYAVCFLYDVLQKSLPNRRTGTVERYQKFLASIPYANGRFTPYQHSKEFRLLHTSAEHLIEWPDPIPRRWPHGFFAKMRILWIAKPDVPAESSREN